LSKISKKIVVHLHGYISVSYTEAILASCEEHKHRITLDGLILECLKDLVHLITLLDVLISKLVPLKVFINILHMFKKS